MKNLYNRESDNISFNKQKTEKDNFKVLETDILKEMEEKLAQHAIEIVQPHTKII